MKKLKLLSIISILILLSACASEANKLPTMKVIQSYPLMGDPVDFDVSGNTIFVAEDLVGFSVLNKKSGQLLHRVDNLDIRYVKLTRFYSPSNILFVVDRTQQHRVLTYKYLESSNTLNQIASDTGSTWAIRDIQFEEIPNDSEKFHTYWGFYQSGENFFRKAVYDIQQNSLSGSRVSIPNHVYTTVISDNYLFLAMGQRGLYILNKSNMNYISECDTPVDARDIVVKNNFVYVADNHNQLQIIDITDIQNPVLLESNISLDGNITSLDISGNLLAIGSTTGGVMLLDISNPAVPQFRDRLSFSEIGYLNKLKFSGNELYIASRDRGILRIKIVK